MGSGEKEGVEWEDATEGAWWTGRMGTGAEASGV
jgi:hypothetical protein